MSEFLQKKAYANSQIQLMWIKENTLLLALNPNLTLSIMASYYNIGLVEEEERDWLKRAEKIVSDKKHFQG